ncbi:hypothetical protein CKO15_10295 [Halorhodospira abdelmalekii]|uniref:AMP-binding protein n=1 Tax=Halorhodospira abdelmalekii TaxID=421629 RepID=UPI001904E109|nr:AMP-binding protein [Halorhodospira abdelmalekii]MBK1735666.1 hypothetical protein [Halorhodospira abdelmalekii]
MSPLLISHPPERRTTREQLLRRAQMLATELSQHVHTPATAPVINLCRERDHFLLLFCAALLAHRTTLLPPSPTPHVIEALKHDHPGALQLDDQALKELAQGDEISASHRHSDPSTPAATSPSPLTALLNEHAWPSPTFTAVTLHTSGSTGEAQPHRRTWQQLRSGAALLAQRLALGERRYQLIGTVPAQHTYGLETTILLPLLTEHTVCAGCPLFPEDLRSLLTALSPPRILVTSPPHLRACLESAIEWPQTELILSATAPLSAELAQQAEERFGARVLEIYGSTETGALATRRTVETPIWQPLEGVELEAANGNWIASGPHFPSCTLHDVLELDPNGPGFFLHGRSRDMLKIAGKRHSAAALSALLQAAPGVRDAVILPPEDNPWDPARVAALVVAAPPDAAAVKGWLREHVDPVFLPRPLLFVDTLPRDPSGKLPRAALIELLERRRMQDES